MKIKYPFAFQEQNIGLTMTLGMHPIASYIHSKESDM